VNSTAREFFESPPTSDQPHFQNLRQVNVRRNLLNILLLSAAYCVTAIVGLSFAISPGNSTAVWPPSGIAVGALLIFGNRLWPGVWMGALLSTLLATDVTPLTAVAFATGNTLESILAAWLGRKLLEIDKPFHKVCDAFWWLSIAFVSCSVAATCGAVSLILGGYIPAGDGPANWSTWWLGDLTGMMVVTPVILAWQANRKTHLQPGSRERRRPAEAFSAILLLAVVSYCIFGGPLREQVAEDLLYVPLIVLFWLLLRFDSTMVFLGNLVIVGIAIWGTSRNTGAFATAGLHQSLFDLQVFMNLYALTGLVLSGILAGSRDSESRRTQLAATAEDDDFQMRVASNIQRHLFPKNPTQSIVYSCAGSCRSADLTSGDYYDFIAYPDGTQLMIVADVSGHGIGPALLMVETRAYARALFSQNKNLTTALIELNRLISNDVSDGRFVTFFVCRFDPSDSTLQFVGAGHEGRLIRASGEFQRLKSSTLPLGLGELLINPIQETLHIEPGDTVLILTDGLIEAKSASRELFGWKRLQQLVETHKQETAEELLDVIFDAVSDFSYGNPQADDQTAAVLRLGRKDG
jgi:serine phosphatase RsbU (regulator of sigma subunit)/integral membrane sensor domain MASE1